MQAEEGIPPVMAALWAPAAPSSRGRPAGLSAARAVAEAVALADEEGLAAVSMSRLAGRLGFTPMSLYRHVSGKDESWR